VMKTDMRDDCGMTLIELMISTALIAILVAGFGLLLTGGWRMWFVQDARVEIERSAGAINETIMSMISQAQASSVVLSRYNSVQPPYSKVDVIRETGTGTENISFYQVGKYLYLERNGTKTIINRHIRRLSFTYPRTDDDSGLEIAVCLQKPTYEGQVDTFYLSIQKVRLRN